MFSHTPAQGLRRGALAALLLLAFTLLVSLLVTRWRIQSMRSAGGVALDRLERLECALSLAELTVMATVFLGILLPLEKQSRRHVHELKSLNRRLAARNRRLHRSRRDRARLAAIVESSGDAILGMDLEATVESVNPAASSVFDTDLTNLERTSLFDLVIPEDRRILHAALSEVTHGATIHRLLQGTNQSSSHLSFTLSPIRQQNEVVGVSAIVRDVTDSVQDAQRLRALNERYQLATEGARDILWDWDCQADEFHIAQRWRTAVGAERHGPVEVEEWWGRVHPEDRPGLDQAFESLALGHDTHLQVEHRIRNARGHYRWFLCRGAVHRDDRGRVLRMAGSLTDITQRRRQSEALMRKALYDDLTGLANRGHLLGKLRDRVDSERRREHRFAVLYLDLDGFKRVNDTWGHAAGDALLEQVARRLEQCVRDGDLVARMGGDEYAVLLDHVDGVADACVVAERIRDSLARPFQLEQEEFVTGASVGVACVDRPGARPEDILRNADTAMYKAKHAGKGTVVVFRPEMSRSSRDPVRVEPRRRRDSNWIAPPAATARIRFPSTTVCEQDLGERLESWLRHELEQGRLDSDPGRWSPDRVRDMLTRAHFLSALLRYQGQQPAPHLARNHAPLPKLNRVILSAKG